MKLLDEWIDPKALAKEFQEKMKAKEKSDA